MDKMIIGIMYSLIAGILVATQNVFSTRISEKVGMWETTVIVHLVGLVVAIILASFLGNGNYKNVVEVNKVYLLAGAVGVGIIYSVPMGISTLGASFGITLIVIAQLGFATVIDTLGLFGSERIPFDGTKLTGIIIMIIGVVIFKWKG